MASRILAALSHLACAPSARAAFAILLLGELLVVSVTASSFTMAECRAAAPFALCAALAGAVLRAVTLCMVLAIILLPRRAALAAFAAGLRARLDPRWLGLHLAGFAAVAAPATFFDAASAPALGGLAIALWIGGGAAAALGAALAPAPAKAWAALLRAGGWALVLAIPAALAAPEIARVFQGAWRIDAVTAVTFDTVTWLLAMLGQDPFTDPGKAIIGIGEFSVQVAAQCSGLEGFVLITGFTGLYIWMFRGSLNVPRALILIPLGLALSWALNTVRIAGLILIGAHGSPGLAENGFHSHAGWLMFTLLSLSLAAAAHRTPWLRREAAPAPAPRAPLPPLTEDWNAARLAPFMAFMAGSLLASTFVETPDLAYPLRAAITLATLLAFRGQLMRLDWRVDPLAIGLGAVIGGLWIATAQSPDAAPGGDPLGAALAALPVWALAIWIAARTLGTALLVPVLEELLFRSYLLERFDLRDRLGVRMGMIVAVAGSTALFAALHDRWIAAALAGLVFAALALRRGRLADAIWCHAAANAVIAAAAILSGRWSLI